uniref:Acyltransferase 3 domain-containing protein n=1 Tax=Panagrolaimus sp. ES5 TaxID=591445 RepID=A0AC34GU66_9BILA
MVYGTFYDYYIAIPAKEKQEIFMRQYSYLSQGSNFLKYQFPFEPDATLIGDGTKQKQNKFANLLMMFSMRRNTEQIMSTRTQDDQIASLHGARFLNNLIQTLRKFPQIFYNQIVVQATLAVDSFFFLSGLLTTYIFIKKLKHAKAREKQTGRRAAIRLDNPSVWIMINVWDGYLLNTKPVVQGEFKLVGIKLWAVWCLATFLGGYSVFGLWHYTKTGEISRAWHMGYTLFGRLSFSLFLGWTIFACQTGHADKINRILGHKFFIPLSKMTFCAYLIHPILLQLYYLSRNQAFHFTHAFQMFYMFSVAVFVSYAVAFILCIAFEQPVTNFDKLVFQEQKSSAPPKADTEIELRETQPSLTLQVPDRPIILGGDPPSALKKPNH